MACIYKIWNEINDKIYIGQTQRALSLRWSQHKTDSHNKTKENHLYKAINKYGIKYFHIEKIEDCSITQLDEREKYWIRYYDSYNNGYNETIGGQGRQYNMIENKEIFDLWEKGLGISEIANKLNTTRNVIRNRIQDCNTYTIEESIRRGYLESSNTKNKKIYQWDLFGNFIKVYDSAMLAEKETNISRKNISNVICKKSNTAGNYYWTEEPYLKIKLLAQYDLNNNFIKYFKNLSDVKKQLNYNKDYISKVCKGERESYKNYIWRIEEKEFKL